MLAADSSLNEKTKRTNIGDQVSQDIKSARILNQPGYQISRKILLKNP